MRMITICLICVAYHKSILFYVLAGFKPVPTKSDTERVTFLFELYQKYTSLLHAQEKPKKRKKS
jgi:hypothetical protein